MMTKYHKPGIVINPNLYTKGFFKENNNNNKP